ncbi:MAG: hypothetical protein K8F52_13885 [Candidatus Scalindua rubra]|uniref:Uncharacterized protein n=1 Tax=Candidatus Scalindua brodae TaxID=237368 RepID=A0A0B0EL80_9BACT|nr:MAG: hypothetical protein SCABRO_00384 [Candidatus Scalindua brodae]MBZ0109751.1 hypothetical protein [Candidatus Scalindua rubra]TWU32376.1 hypothetical protein S225a_17680 [Candidatus Brocadiaceae bacterium S225]
MTKEFDEIMYTLSGCQYCYATSSFEKAKALYENHNQESTSMVDYSD